MNVGTLGFALVTAVPAAAAVILNSPDILSHRCSAAEEVTHHLGVPLFLDSQHCFVGLLSSLLQHY